MMDEHVGTGEEAQRGSTVTYNARLFLPRGDEVTRDPEILALNPDLPKREVGDITLIDVGPGGEGGALGRRLNL